MGKYHSPYERDTIELIKFSSAIISGLLLFLSFLYLFTYYSFFDVNIFNYISINTIVSYSIQSIGVIVVLSIFGYSFLLVYDFIVALAIKLEFLLEKNLITSKHKGKKYTLRAIFFIILILFAVFAPIYVIDFLFDNGKYSLLVQIAFASLIFVVLYLSIKNFPKSFKPTRFTFKTFWITITLVTSLLTVSKALLDALYFYEEVEYKYVMGSELKGDYPDEKLKLIGKSQNHYFLKHPNKEGILIKQFDDFKELRLRTYREPEKSD